MKRAKTLACALVNDMPNVLRLATTFIAGYLTSALMKEHVAISIQILVICMFVSSMASQVWEPVRRIIRTRREDRLFVKQAERLDQDPTYEQAREALRAKGVDSPAIADLLKEIERAKE